MTTLTKVGSKLSDAFDSLKDKVCNDGTFCDDVLMAMLGIVTVWMMVEAMKPLI